MKKSTSGRDDGGSKPPKDPAQSPAQCKLFRWDDMDTNGTLTIGREESAALRRLRDAVEGQVITPADNDYEGARMAWNLTIQQYPAIIVVADSIADVQAAEHFANAENL